MLQEEELRHPPLTPAASPGSPAVLITNGSFAWEAGGIPLLRHISLEIPAGRLMIVIGEVGAGTHTHHSDCAFGISGPGHHQRDIL